MWAPTHEPSINRPGPLAQVVPQQPPDPAAPLVNGTYLIANVGRSIACGSVAGLSYLARAADCEALDSLTTSTLQPDNVLQLKWEIALVPGNTHSTNAL